MCMGNTSPVIPYRYYYYIYINIEVWVGMGFPVGKGIPWNGECGMGMEMGIISVRMGVSKNT